MNEDKLSGNVADTVEPKSTITCPECGHREIEAMPTDACELAGREAGHPDLSPFRTHRAQSRQWAQDKAVHVASAIKKEV
jgi:hypothetical protein